MDNRYIKAAGSFDSFCNHLASSSETSADTVAEFEEFEAFLEEKGIDESDGKAHFESFLDFNDASEESEDVKELTEAEAHFQAFREFVDKTGSDMSLDAFEEWHNSATNNRNQTSPLTWDSGDGESDATMTSPSILVPLTVSPMTLSENTGSLETTAAVK